MNALRMPGIVIPTRWPRLGSGLNFQKRRADPSVHDKRTSARLHAYYSNSVISAPFNLCLEGSFDVLSKTEKQQLEAAK